MSLNFNPIQVNLTFWDRSEQVKGYPVTDGMTVHRNDRGGWNLTHTKSGLALDRGFKTRTTAIAAFKAAVSLEGTADWTRCENDVVADPTIIAIHKRLMAFMR